jgi:acetyl esterase/lipase
MTFQPTTAGPLELGTAAYPMNPSRIGPDGTLRYDDLVYSCEPGYRPLFLDLRLPQEPADDPYPLIVWIHGGGWMHGSRKRQAPNIDAHHVIGQLGAAGYAVALVDYRLSREAPFPAPMLDLRAAVRWLRGYADLFGIDSDRIALWGESAGAHLALMTAWCHRGSDATVGEFLDESETVQAVVEWYGPIDLTASHFNRPIDTRDDASGETSSRGDDPVAMLLDGSAWTRTDISPLTYVRADLPPTLIAHGSDDRLVPVVQSRQLHAALTEAGAPVDYIEVPGDHVFVGSESIDEVVKRGIDFLGSVLPPATD